MLFMSLILPHSYNFTCRISYEFIQIYLFTEFLYDSINLLSQTILFQGCYHIVVSFIYENLTKIGIGILISASVHILGLVLTCLLAKNVKRAEYEEIR